MSKNSLNRREFLAGAGAAGLSVMTARSWSRVQGANDRIVMALIGAGGRGRGVMRSFQKVPGIEFAAVCDVYEPNIGETQRTSCDNCKGAVDYHEVLDNKDIQAVLIATPDHWHGPMLLDALSAGKDIYLEKPFSHSIEQGARMVKAARATKQIVQVGMQRRSSPAVQAAKKAVDDGTLGDIVLARAQWFWNQPPLPKSVELKGKLDWDRFQAPCKHKRPMDPVRWRVWRNFWDYSGGHCTDQGTHLMDVIQWFANDGKPPLAAECYGATYNLIGAEVPDTFCAVFQYPKFVATWTLTYGNSYMDGWTIILQGRKGTMVLDDRGYRIYSEPWPKTGQSPEPVMEYKGGIPTEPHVENFVDCVRSRKEPNAPVEVGHYAVCGPHLANVSLLRKQRATLNPEATRART
ncbi:MAG: oxidoreductase domain protein [Acidobacteria bacterium]|jgi:predicted dehydrogenase|nr:oxidoreductase domain protein [Acidobacteriota bacterium]